METLYEQFSDPFKEDLDAVLANKKEAYRAADPFPHCCIDNLIADELLEKVIKEFPRPDSKRWKLLESEGTSHRKLITKNAEKLGPYTKHLVGRLSSPYFLQFMEELTGIEGLIPDPYLDAAGLHQIQSGGFLEVHVDFYRHKKLKLYRRLNLLLYMNKDWKEEYGGHLELWNKDLQKRAEYLPIWNRMLVSIIAPHAYHGFPNPIQCPEDTTRKSLAIWYYTSDLPDEVKKEYELHKPDWIKRVGHGNDHDHDHDSDGYA